MTFDSITRRALLQGLAASAAAGALSGLPWDMALAKARLTNKAAPSFYRFKVGAFEATVVSDGPLSLGEPSGNVFVGISKEQLTELLRSNFLPTDKFTLDQNVLVVNTGSNLVLFDTGTGKSVNAFGPNVGRLLTNLKAAGINPSDIDTIALTHAHADHCFGLMSETGKRNFPKAQIYMTQADYDFWTDEAKGTNDIMKLMVGGARRNLMPNRGRIVFVSKDRQEIVPGIFALATPGHTVGHTSYMITSQNQSLCNLGDVGHSHIVSVERPRVEFAYDTDGKQAVASRLRMYDMLATDRIPMVSYHFPWPGVGYLAKQSGESYRYYSAPYQTIL
jgi:glyoxylase-like metal-dependent hydrolase (beta-lactamase superfamily II)